ncbi:hypothetical protein [Chryseobacterium herbae]|uniref:Uncharacterized protein n=1 Tax=Chryseobacterium herbae TaxID=2976476 RepID=A0ABT2IUB3_9FLAO|nr:hypothetical protein [Chryseobacterium sp. pc1-10]MCT2562416.1 hypothetical protein [Chryseobacterium sp. pc1-10]
MKKMYYVLLFSSGLSTYAQVGISNNPADQQPHPNAILDVKSTTPAKAVMLPTVTQIGNAADPDGDEAFKGAIIYNKGNGSIYEHDGTNWRSVYQYTAELQPQYLAHFSRPSDLNLSCSSGILPPYGCSADGIIPLTGTGPSDFIGNLIKLSIASNIVTVNEAGTYRITYRSYAVFQGLNTDLIQLRLQKANSAAPNNFTTIDYKEFTDTNDGLDYNPVFNGSIVLQASAGDKFRLQGYMESGLSPIITSSTVFQNRSTYGTGEFIFEKVIL